MRVSNAAQRLQIKGVGVSYSLPGHTQTQLGPRSLKAHKPIRAINATLFDQNVHNELPHAVNDSGREALNQARPSPARQGRHFIAQVPVGHLC